MVRPCSTPRLRYIEHSHAWKERSEAEPRLSARRRGYRCKRCKIESKIVGPSVGYGGPRLRKPRRANARGRTPFPPPPLSAETPRSAVRHGDPTEVRRPCTHINRDCSAIAGGRKRRGAQDVQAIFCRRRHQARRPPHAKIRPGSPAPTMGPGTALPLTKMLSKLAVPSRSMCNWSMATPKKGLTWVKNVLPTNGPGAKNTC